jgi:hypothetical protein
MSGLTDSSPVALCVLYTSLLALDHVSQLMSKELLAAQGARLKGTLRKEDVLTDCECACVDGRGGFGSKGVRVDSNMPKVCAQRYLHLPP